MKRNIYFIAALLFILASCHTEKLTNNQQESYKDIQKSLQDFGSAKTEYRTYPASIKFFDPKTTSDQSQVVAQKMAFIKSSGLPDETNIWEWKQLHPVSDALNIYRIFIANNSADENLQIFRQYAAWLILTRLDLLSQTSPESLEQIHYLVDNLVQTEYTGYQLLDYSIKHFINNNYSNKEGIKKMGQAILQYSKAVYEQGQKNESSIRIVSGSKQPLSPELENSIKKTFLNSYNANASALESIKNSIEKILFIT